MLLIQYRLISLHVQFTICCYTGNKLLDPQRNMMSFICVYNGCIYFKYTGLYFSWSVFDLPEFLGSLLANGFISLIIEWNSSSIVFSLLHCFHYLGHHSKVLINNRATFRESFSAGRMRVASQNRIVLYLGF